MSTDVAVLTRIADALEELVAIAKARPGVPVQEDPPFESDREPDMTPAPAEEVTVDNVRALIKKVSGEGHKAKVVEAIKTLGFSRLADVPEDYYPELNTAILKATADA